jgi:K+-sensing histidine kinase KdpD
MLLKIFLTFWLTVALLAAGQELISVMAQRDEQAALNDARALVSDAQTRDHGPGVADGAAQTMFRRFWRDDRVDQSASDGAGLGLAIADSVVRVHGGTIGAANAGTGGLLVTIDLPVTE